MGVTVPIPVIYVRRWYCNPSTPEFDVGRWLISLDAQVWFINLSAQFPQDSYLTYFILVIML